MEHPVTGRENEEIAKTFEFIAGLLESRNANPYRVHAYRNAAQTLRELDRSAAEIAETEGTEGLLKLPAIGRSLARSITEYVYTGRMSVFDRIRGRTDPISLIASLPGIGPDMAERIHEHLGVDTLEELEVAAHDGDLAEVPGMGRKRVKGIIDVLAGRLGPSRRTPVPGAMAPSVAELLDVDREYREKAQAGQLRRVAPKRFNPTGEAWLPVMQTRRRSHYFTALYSNTARAHDLGKTHDWVVIYYDSPQGSGQYTVVTGRQGPLAGKRIVRGREQECVEYYERARAA